MFLPQLLTDLEAVFREAGGGPTGVRRVNDERNTRRSRFVSFAWAAILHLPADMRPSSEQALAAAWERIRSKRKESIRKTG
jgi:hypothetical protein